MKHIIIKDLENTLNLIDQFKGRTLYLGDYETDSQLGIPSEVSGDIIPLIKGIILHKLKTLRRDNSEQSWDK